MARAGQPISASWNGGLRSCYLYLNQIYLGSSARTQRHSPQYDGGSGGPDANFYNGTTCPLTNAPQICGGSGGVDAKPESTTIMPTGKVTGNWLLVFLSAAIRSPVLTRAYPQKVGYGSDSRT